MTAITKTWSSIADSAVDPDSPVTTGLITGLRDNGIFVREWLGESFFAGAVQNHDHDGVNSASVPVGPNALRNGSFEDGETGWTFADFSGGSHAISTSNHADGAKSMGFVSTVLANGGGEAVANEYRSCGNNEPIPLSFWVWASVAGVSSRVEIIWYDNAKSQISATTVRQYTSTPTAAIFHGEVARAPNNARWFRTRITGGVPAVGTATGTVRFDGIRISAAQPPGAIAGPRPLGLLKLGGFDFAQATTAYLKAIGLQADATELNVEMYVQKPFTMRELRAFAATAVPGGQSVVFTVRKNAADTALACTIGAGQTQASDVSNSIDFGAGDRWSIKCVSSATAGTNDYSATAKQINPATGSGAAQIWYRSTTGGINRYVAELGGTSDPGGGNLGLPVGRCFARAVGAQTAPLANLEFRRNNSSVLTDLTMLSGWAKDVLEPGVAFAAGDDLFLFGPAAAARALCVLFGSPDKSTLHDPCYAGFGDAGGVQAETRYMAGYGWDARATESEVQIQMPACTLKNLRGLCSITVPAGQTITVTARKNGVDTGLTMQFTNGGGTKASDVINTVQFAAGDLLSLQRVSSATTGSFAMHASIEIEESGA